MNYIKFDPNMLISPPFWNCPKCREVKCFGVLMVKDNHYIRRCKKCSFKSGYCLPELNKKIIYIDQFVLSNMMKSINPDTNAYKKGVIAKHWKELFVLLDRLCKLQLIICPDSTYHKDESLMSPFYKQLKRMYKLFSNGISFKDEGIIKTQQVYKHATLWVNNKDRVELDRHEAIDGNINKWQDKLIVSVDFASDFSWVEELRNARQEAHKNIIENFERWQQGTDKKFNDWYNEQCASFGLHTLEDYLNYHKKKQLVFQGLLEPTKENLLPNFSVLVVQAVVNAFKTEGLKDEELSSKVNEYFHSDKLCEIPYIKLSAMLLASLARKASAGQKQPPNQGTVYDFNIISVILPYCDAGFIDKDNYAYLKESPLQNEIDKYGTKIFSLNNIEEFFGYLNQIEKEATNEHILKIHEVYGDIYNYPYTALYKKG